MKDLAIIANMKKAARDRSLTTIGGGVFAPEEVKQAARLLEAVPELVEALVAFRDASGGNFTGWHQKYEKAVGLARAALAKVTPT